MIGYLDFFRDEWKQCRLEDREIVDLLASHERLPDCICIFVHLTDLRLLPLFAAGDPNCLDEVPMAQHALFQRNGLALWNGLQSYAGRMVVYRGEEWDEKRREELRRLKEQFGLNTIEPAQEPLDRQVRVDRLADWVAKHLRPIERLGIDEFEAVVRLTLDLELLKQYRGKRHSDGAEVLLELPGLEVLKPLPDLTPIWDRLRERSRALDVSALALRPDLHFLGEFLEKEGTKLVIAREYEQEWIKRLSPTTGKSGEPG